MAETDVRVDGDDPVGAVDGVVPEGTRKINGACERGGAMTANDGLVGQSQTAGVALQPTKLPRGLPLFGRGGVIVR